MSIQLTGIVHSVGQTEQKTDSFSVREMILTVDPSSQYPAHITVQASNKNTTLLDNLKKGDSITVDVNLNGRLYTTKDGVEKSFNSLNVWRVTATGDTATNTQSPSTQEEVDDLPW